MIMEFFMTEPQSTGYTIPKLEGSFPKGITTPHVIRQILENDVEKALIAQAKQGELDVILKLIKKPFSENFLQKEYTTFVALSKYEQMKPYLPNLLTQINTDHYWGFALKYSGNALLYSNIKLGITKILGYIKEIDKALEALRGIKMVHGDVSPSNIVVFGNKAILIDWESAIPTGRKGVSGTEAFMSRSVHNVFLELTETQASLSELSTSTPIPSTSTPIPLTSTPIPSTSTSTATPTEPATEMNFHDDIESLFFTLLYVLNYTNHVEPGIGRGGLMFKKKLLEDDQYWEEIQTRIKTVRVRRKEDNKTNEWEKVFHYPLSTFPLFLFSSFPRFFFQLLQLLLSRFPLQGNLHRIKNMLVDCLSEETCIGSKTCWSSV